MIKKGLRFNIEEVADLAVEDVVKLSDKMANTRGEMPEDFTILYRELRGFKRKHGFKQDDPVDVLILANYQDEDARDLYSDVKELHNRINFKLSEHPDIATFFNGSNGRLSFHFPGGLSLWIMTPDEYFYKLRDKMNVISVYNIGISGINTMFAESDKKLKGKFKFTVLEPNAYFDVEKHIEKVW